jgi:uncharacterized membrane protein required for colicin V production
MNWLDLLLILIAAAAVISGAREGLSRSGLGFLGVILAVAGALWMAPETVLGFVAGFVLVLFAEGLLGHVASRSLRQNEEDWGWLDRSLGAVCGMANAAVAWAVIVMALLIFAPAGTRAEVAESRFAPGVAEAFFTLADQAPDELRAAMHSGCRKLQEALPRQYRSRLPHLRGREI